MDAKDLDRVGVLRLLRCVFLIVLFLPGRPPGAHAATTGTGSAPWLELLGISATRVVQLKLHGEDASKYLLEVSNDLVQWQAASATAVRTTGGVALLSHNARETDSALYFRVRQTTSTPIPPALPVLPKLSSVFSVTSVITPEGGTAELFMPDLRRIVLTIPAGCVLRPQEFTMTLVTSFDNLPFARGALGAVRLEPEGLLLSGAASLEIYFPAAVEKLEICSYSVNTDGSSFRLFPDRILSDHVLLPITRFSTYGSSLAELSELESLLGRPLLSPGPAALHANAVIPPDVYGCVLHESDFSTDTSEFPESCKTCFSELVARALQARRDITGFVKCLFEPDIAFLLGYERQKQLLGANPNPDLPDIDLVEDYLKKNICGVYFGLVQPLWEEAKHNCPLNVVLLTFVLGFDRQLQLLGVTNGLPCKGTLSDNLANACDGARECLREIQLCCNLGHRGFAKQQEIYRIVNRFDLLGANCFPEGYDDQDVVKALDACLTNIWVGSLVVKEYVEKTVTTADGRIETYQVVDDQFSGVVYQSSETPDLFGSGKTVNLQIIGDASLKLRNRVRARLERICSDGGRVTEETVGTTDTVGVKYGSADSLDGLFGSYGAMIQLMPFDRIYRIDFIGGGLNNAVTKELNLRHAASCDGGEAQDEITHTATRNASLSIFPSVFDEITRLLPDPPTKIKSSYTTKDNSQDPPTNISFTWNFRRLVNPSAPEP